MFKKIGKKIEKRNEKVDDSTEDWTIRKKIKWAFVQF